MPRKARDERLDTRTARLKLPVRREPYWRNIAEGHAIGYRRVAGGNSGRWIARHYDPDREPIRLYHALGTADDLIDADGSTILTFAQAQDAAGEWFKSIKNPATTEPMTVEQAAEHYLRHYAAKGGKQEAATRQTIAAHILPTLGDRLLEDLTPAIIKAWRDVLATSPARLRSGKEGVRKLRAATDAATRRARRATANRILTVLKAMLNVAYQDGLVASDDAWRRVKPFADTQAAKVRYLTDDEAARLVNACSPDFRLLVTAALLTGCRYGELCNLRAGDIDLANGSATVREAKGGKPRVVTLTGEAVRLLEQAAAGKPRNGLVFTRDDGEPWGKSHQTRRLADACAAASISPAIGFHILRHTHASRLAMRGVSMSVIAAQLGNSEAICAKHYAHLSPSYVADQVRQAFGDTGLVPESNIEPLKMAR